MRCSVVLIAATSCLAGEAKAQNLGLTTGSTQEERSLELSRAFPQCPPAGGGEEDEIVICAQPRESARYRLPRRVWTPDGPVASVSRERHMLYEQGDVGIGSCSNVGPGGYTGCAHRAWKAAREQHGR